MKRRTYNNVLKATGMIQEKGYTFSEANEIAIKIFDEHENGEMPIEHYIKMVATKEEWLLGQDTNNVKPRTIKQFFENGGNWHFECDASIPHKAMSVDVEFLNSQKATDEVEFDIKPFNIGELDELFTDFCKENNIDVETITAIHVVSVWSQNLDEV